MVRIAVNRAAKGAKLAIGASGVGSAQSAQTVATGGVITDVNVGATRASIGTAVVSGVTASTIDPLIMAGSTAVRLMVDATATTGVATVEGVMPGQLIVHAIGVPDTKIRRTRARMLCCPRWQKGALVPVIW